MSSSLHISSNYKNLKELIVFVHQDMVGEYCDKYGISLQGLFEGKSGEVLVWPVGSEIHFLVGLGEDIHFKSVENCSIKFFIKFKNKINKDKVAIEVFSPTDVGEPLMVGFFKSDYRSSIEEGHFLHSIEELFIPISWHDKVSRARIIADSQKSAMTLLDLPANKKTIPILTQWIVDFAQRLKIEINVFNRDQCEKMGLDAFLAVNRGSEYPGSFVVLRHKHPEAQKSIGLVGKCITFDTGGISIKPSNNLHYMKSDMGGAAAVIGAIEAMVSLDLAVDVIGILPITDNAVSVKSYMPSDVIDSHAGKTIEVIDTDAEGRLILADGLSYIVENYNPDYLIDVATLTGSTVRTFGYHCAALFSNNDELADRIIAAGEEIGERLWRLPLWSAYKDHLKSDVADIKNFSGTPTSGACDAAAFLQEFTRGHKAWAHLDVAGVAFGKSHFVRDKGATGYGSYLLLRFAEHILS